MYACAVFFILFDRALISSSRSSAGNELLPYSKYDFKFKDYAPWVFRSLRESFNIDAADYLVSLTGKYMLSELGSPGKSGSFFYFSADYRFIIKTISHTEHKFFRKILRDYHDVRFTLISRSLLTVLGVCSTFGANPIRSLRAFTACTASSCRTAARSTLS